MDRRISIAIVAHRAAFPARATSQLGHQSSSPCTIFYSGITSAILPLLGRTETQTNVPKITHKAPSAKGLHQESQAFFFPLCRYQRLAKIRGNILNRFNPNGNPYEAITNTDLLPLFGREPAMG